MILGQAESEIPATTEAIIIPNAVNQRPQEQLIRGDTESSTAPMDIETTDVRDSEEDEVDFWGGTRPRERASLEETMRPEREAAGSGSDESMSDEDLDMMDEDDNDNDDDEDDEMAIFGHR